MELSINILGLYGEAAGEAPVSPSQGIALALRDGFRVFDFPLANMKFYADGYEKELERALETAAKGGGEIRYGHVPFHFPWDNETEENWAKFDAVMAKAIDAAHFLNLRYVAMHPYTTNVPVDEYDPAPCKEAAIRHLIPWLEQCDRLGVKLCAENMQGDEACFPHRRYCAKVDELIDLVDTLKMPGIVWDTGHAHIAVHKQSEALQKVGSRLKMLHIHDNDACRDLHLLPYTGSIDWNDFIEGLKAIHYQGDINYEQNLKGIPSRLRAPVIAYLRDVGNEFIRRVQEA